jgi:hypothetical protein
VYEPGDQFYVFLAGRNRYGRRIVVARIDPKADVLPRGPEDPEVERILLCTRPLELGKKTMAQTWERAERITEKLNNMTLSVQVADLEGSLQELFDELWTTINRGA